MHLPEDDIPGRFCPWYALSDIPERTPQAPGVYQLRRRAGLISYPRGKSAMVQYGHAGNMRAALVKIASAHAPHTDLEALFCRHQRVEDERAAEALHAELRTRFVRRFGADPIGLR